MELEGPPTSAIIECKTPGASPLSPTEKNELHKSKHDNTESQVHAPPRLGGWFVKHTSACLFPFLQKKVSHASCVSMSVL